MARAQLTFVAVESSSMLDGRREWSASTDEARRTRENDIADAAPRVSSKRKLEGRAILSAGLRGVILAQRGWGRRAQKVGTGGEETRDTREYRTIGMLGDGGLVRKMAEAERLRSLVGALWQLCIAGQSRRCKSGILEAPRVSVQCRTGG